jgi:hypothetical protein
MAFTPLLRANLTRLTAGEIRFLRSTEEKNSNRDEDNNDDAHEDEEELEEKKRYRI